MQQAERTIDLWSQQVRDAFWRHRERVIPSWKRKLRAENTPDYEQAKFEEEAIKKESLRIFKEELACLAR